MATFIQLKTYVWDATGTASTIISATNAGYFVNGAVDLMQQAHLWRCQETISADTAYAANLASLALPSNFIAEKAIYLKNASATLASNLYWYVPRLGRDEWYEKTPTTLRTDVLFPQTAMPGSEDATIAMVYAIWDETLALLPTPQTAQTVVLDYYARTTALSADADTNAFTATYAHVVRAGAVAEAFEFLHEDERAALWRARFEAMLARAILDDKTLAASGGVWQRGV